MDINTCIKYLEFMDQECDRHLRDGQVTDDELIQMSVELPRFKQQCINSNLSNDIKEKITSLSFDYTSSRIKRNAILYIIGILTLGFWVFILWQRNQTKRILMLQSLKNQISGSIIHIKMNY